MSNVIDLDEHRDANFYLDRLKDCISAEEVVICAVNQDGTISTLIQSGVSDIDLVYIIQCLKDRRQMRLEE